MLAKKNEKEGHAGQYVRGLLGEIATAPPLQAPPVPESIDEIGEAGPEGFVDFSFVDPVSTPSIDATTSSLNEERC